MILRPYPEYKDSGVEWLGEIPSHWSLVQLKRLFRFAKIQEKAELPVLSVYRDYGVIEKASRDDNNNKTPEDLSLYQSVAPRDLVINKMKSWQGSLGISEYFGITSPDYAVYQPIHKNNDSFLNYTFRNKRMVSVYKTISNGIRPDQWRLEPGKFETLLFALPNIAEQSAIAAFLDRETGKIDALIAEQEKLIELLREKRQAVISHAVTKGLDPTAPMKDSGVEWLGKMPEHWSTVPLKNLVTFRSGGTPSKAVQFYWNGDVPWASAKDMKHDRLEETGDHLTEAALADGAATLVDSGAVLVVVRGMILARLFPVSLLAKPMAINQDLKAVLAGPRLTPQFLAWALRGTSEESLRRLDEAGHGTKALRMEAWASMSLACPPLAEQSAIAAFLDSRTKEMDELIAAAQSAIDLLKERRSALISAAVTGKIDVRQRTAEIIPFTPRQRRNILAAEVISVCHLDHTFGRTKAQKAFYLLERYLGIEEMDGRYERYVYGPYDGQQLDSIASDLESAEWFREVPLDGRSIYRPLAKADEVGGVFEQAWKGRRAEIGNLIGLLRPLDTQQAEVVATLFAAWNDFLLAGRTVDDDTLITDVRSNWHPSKLAIPIEKWHWGLRWMRENNVIPRGVGRPTIYQTSLL